MDRNGWTCKYCSPRRIRSTLTFGSQAPEGPHIYKRSDAYYLMIAEGGTGLNHMETYVLCLMHLSLERHTNGRNDDRMARAENITGPYTPCPYNPVLTNANTTEYCAYAFQTFLIRVKFRCTLFGQCKLLDMQIYSMTRTGTGGQYPSQQETEP